MPPFATIVKSALERLPQYGQAFHVPPFYVYTIALFYFNTARAPAYAATALILGSTEKLDLSQQNLSSPEPEGSRQDSGYESPLWIFSLKKNKHHWNEGTS